MKISNIQMLNGLRKLAATVLLISLSLLNFNAFSQGEALFKSKCATCHQTHKNGTGPKLFQVRDKWAAGGAKEGSIYTWVNNWQTAAASDPYAAEVSKWSPTAMSAFPDLKKEDIDAILDWVDAQPDPASATPSTGGATANSSNLDFTGMPACTVVAVAVLDNSTGGNILIHGTLTANKSLDAGDTLRIATGDLDITID
jgi:mono/diheme cytochrome c family protein